MVGEFLDLQRAKQKISSINSGSRVIADVNSMGELNNDPEKIASIMNEQNIVVEEKEIYKLLNLCEEYLQRLRSKF